MPSKLEQHKIEHIKLGAFQVVFGPSSSADNALVRFNGTNGDIIQSSPILVDDNGSFSNVGSIQFNTSFSHTHSEGSLCWNDDDKTLNIGTEVSETVIQVGQEQVLRATNKTGGTIPNGSVVYVDGAQGNRPTIAKANASNVGVCESTIGIVTSDIADNATGYVTTFGLIRDLDTDSYSEGDCLYLSTVDGGLTNVAPGLPNAHIFLGIVLYSHQENGVILCRILIAPDHGCLTGLSDDDHTQYTLRDDWGQNGFVTRTTSTLTWTDSSPDRTLSIQPTSTSFEYFMSGVKYTTTGDTVQITDVEGIHVIYYDGSTLTALANPTTSDYSTVIRTKCLVCILYWDTSTSTAIYVGEERHGNSMSPNTHNYLHFVQGLAYLFGLGLNTVNVDGTGVTADAQFGVDTGSVSDEDIYSSIAAVSSTTGLPIYYMLGASAEWQRHTETGFSVRTYDGTSATRLAWNEYTGGAWQLTEVASTRYVLYHVFATTEKDKPMIAIMGQVDYLTKLAARTGAKTEIQSLVLGDLLFPEIRPIATVIFQTNVSYDSAVNARIVSTEEGDDYVDWRNEAVSRVALSTADHGDLTGLGGDDHLQYSLVDGTRAFTGGVGVVGSADEVQLTITGNSSQSADLFVIEKSDSEDVLNIDSDGDTTFTKKKSGEDFDVKFFRNTGTNSGKGVNLLFQDNSATGAIKFKSNGFVQNVNDIDFYNHNYLNLRLPHYGGLEAWRPHLNSSVGYVFTIPDQSLSIGGPVRPIESGFRVGTLTLDGTSPTTVTTASSFYVDAAPASGVKMTIDDSWAFYLAGGDAYFGGNLLLNDESLLRFGGDTAYYPALTGGNEDLYCKLADSGALTDFHAEDLVASGDMYSTGGIQVGTGNETAGTIQWDGSNFQGYTGADWVDLDSAGEGSSDHGELDGLADDDHSQYLLIDGTRAMTGKLLAHDGLAVQDGGYAQFRGDLYTGSFIRSQGQYKLELAFGGARVAFVSDYWGFGYMSLGGIRLTNFSFALNLGDAATTSHSLAAGNVICGNALEVDGMLYADRKVAITGSADEVQLTITGNSSQNADLFAIEKSDGEDIFNVDSGGNVVVYDESLLRFGGDTAYYSALAGGNEDLYCKLADDSALTDFHAEDIVASGDMYSAGATHAGDVLYTGAGAGVPYGYCYGDHIGWTQASAVQNTWYNVVDADMISGSLNLVTHDGNGLLTVTYAGKYLVTFDISYEVDAANDHIEFGIEIDGAAPAADSPHCHTTSKFVNQEQASTGTGIMALAAGQTIQVAMRTIDVGTPDFTVDNVRLTCSMVGG